MTKILVIDDEQNIRELIGLYLRKEGYEVEEAGDGLEALELLKTVRVDLIVLDIMMPKMDGWELCRELRQTSDTPLLMVTAKGEPGQVIKGFELGTDDYLVKPFDPMELVMRVKALIKRYRIASSQIVQVGDVTVDRQSFEVKVGGERLTLPLKEFELLYKLAAYAGQIFTRTQLIEQIWGVDYEGDERTVDVHIKRLRERLQGLTDQVSITTIRGLGYRFEVHT
ncbi:MAG: DNA-binding response regulator [Paenibacillaceae bacterium]|jgi:DNA-binding response OmpR family regulator|nr:DNA-binding response regulator [Paenibacillaceae bacterium]